MIHFHLVLVWSMAPMGHDMIISGPGPLVKTGKELLLFSLFISHTKKTLDKILLPDRATMQ